MLGRIFTDPASVNHEHDWGPWDWAEFVGLALLAAGLVIVGCSMAVRMARQDLGGYIPRNSDGPLGVWGPIVTLLTQALGTFAAVLVGLALLLYAVHGIARHTASMVWALVLIVGIYTVSILALWWLGPLWASSSPLDQKENLWWKWITRVAAGFYCILAIFNLVVEALNKVSGATGVAISMIVFATIVGMLYLLVAIVTQR